MKNYIKPECMTYYYNSGERVDKTLNNGIAYTSDGYLLPCCWCDAPSTKKDISNLGFYNENLKLSNNESVEDVINSGIWKKFVSIILYDYDSAPRCCKEKCGVTNE